MKYFVFNYMKKMHSVVNRVEYDIAVWLLVLLSLYGLYFVYDKEADWNAKRTLFATPLLTVSVLFTFTQCGIVGGKTKGDAPWLMLASGINSNSPSVDESSNGSASGGSGGGAGASLVPVTGMYFLHPDYLGSITMITDGYGNVISGGNNGGKSHISYKPYGEIHRTDSSGPDITRFKYTGQEEDKESGLMYYKARYYDPVIGRFLQADSVIMPQSTFGMNRYMYVDGNPVRYGDSSGNWCNLNYLAALATMINPLLGPIGVWGNYTGQGACGKLLPGKQEDMAITFLFFNAKTDQDRLLILAVYLLRHNVPSALTEVDRASQIHDRDGARPLESPKANNVWIRQVGKNFNIIPILTPIGPMPFLLPTSGMIGRTWNREHNALMHKNTPWGRKHGKYGDATNVVATINTMGTVAGDTLAANEGTYLFRTLNMINYVGHPTGRAKNLWTPRKWGF